MTKNEIPNKNRKNKSSAIGECKFYHVEVRPQCEFKVFRVQDVGKKGGVERVGGQRENGLWETVKWLVGKELAHVENGALIADHHYAQELFDKLGSAPKHIEGDRFEVKV